VHFGDIIAYTTLGTNGFQINGTRVRSLIDPIYPGAVLAVNPIEMGEPEGKSTTASTLITVRYSNKTRCSALLTNTRAKLTHHS
jgi:hypothetical protein